jgi:hypothetical protein
LIIFWSPPSPWPSSSSTTQHRTYHFMSTHLAQWLVPRFHQLSKIKVGLSIFSFLVIDNNLFTNIFNKTLLDSCCLPKHFTMCKGYGQVL